MPRNAVQRRGSAHFDSERDGAEETATTFVLRTLRRHAERNVEPQELTRDVPAGMTPDEIRRAVWDLVGDQKVTLNPDYSMRISSSAEPDSAKNPRRRKAGK